MSKKFLLIFVLAVSLVVSSAIFINKADFVFGKCLEGDCSKDPMDDFCKDNPDICFPPVPSSCTPSSFTDQKDVTLDDSKKASVDIFCGFISFNDTTHDVKSFAPSMQCAADKVNVEGNGSYGATLSFNTGDAFIPDNKKTCSDGVFCSVSSDCSAKTVKSCYDGWVVKDNEGLYVVRYPFSIKTTLSFANSGFNFESGKSYKTDIAMPVELKNVYDSKTKKFVQGARICKATINLKGPSTSLGSGNINVKSREAVTDEPVIANFQIQYRPNKNVEPSNDGGLELKKSDTSYSNKKYGFYSISDAYAGFDWELISVTKEIELSEKNPVINFDLKWQRPKNGASLLISAKEVSGKCSVVKDVEKVGLTLTDIDASSGAGRGGIPPMNRLSPIYTPYKNDSINNSSYNLNLEGTPDGYALATECGNNGYSPGSFFNINNEKKEIIVFVKKTGGDGLGDLHLDARLYDSKECSGNFRENWSDANNLLFHIKGEENLDKPVGAYNPKAGSYYFDPDPSVIQNPEWAKDAEKMKNDYEFCGVSEKNFSLDLGGSKGAVKTVTAFFKLKNALPDKKDYLKVDFGLYNGTKCGEGSPSSFVGEDAAYLKMGIEDKDYVIHSEANKTEISNLGSGSYTVSDKKRPTTLTPKYLWWDTTAEKREGLALKYELCPNFTPNSAVFNDNVISENKNLTGYIRKKGGDAEISCVVDPLSTTIKSGTTQVFFVNTVGGESPLKYEFQKDDSSPLVATSTNMISFVYNSDATMLAKVIDKNGKVGACSSEVKIGNGKDFSCSIKAETANGSSAINGGNLNISSGTKVTFINDMTSLKPSPCREKFKSGEGGTTNFGDCSNNLFVHTYNSEGEKIASSQAGDLLGLGDKIEEDCGEIKIKVSEAEPECFIEADKTKTTAGIPVNITWSTKNAKSCTLKKIVGVKESYINIKGQISGNINEKPFESSRYVLECKNVTKECTATKDITVGFINIIKEINPYF